MRIGIAVIVMTAGACAPSETPRDPKPRVQPNTIAPAIGATVDSPKPVARDTAAETSAALAQALPGDTTPTSQLPARFIPDIPGWLGTGMGYMIVDTVGADPNASAILGLGIFPDDTAWKHIRRATAMILIGDSGRATVFPEGVTGHALHLGNETMLKVRPEEKMNAFWVLPQSEAKDVEVLPIRDSLSADKLTRVWSAGPARIRLYRTNRLSARMVGEFNGHSVARKDPIGINASADSSMGVGDQTDSILDLKQGWMIPSVYAALRFGRNGPIVVLFAESGYECNNVRVVVFRASGVEWIEEPHFYGDCAS